MGATDVGLVAPPGTSLILSDQWFDGNTMVRSGGTMTVASGATMTYAAGSTATFSGTVNMPSVNGTTANDLSEVIAPSSYGLSAYNYPYLFATGTGSAATVAGRLYLAKIPLAAGTVVTNIWFSIATAASGITTGQNFAGIYSSTGSLLATTGDLSTVIGTNTGALQAPLTAPFTVPSGGNYYIGIFFNASVTLPVLTCYTGQVTVTTSVANFGSTTTFGNTAAKYPFAVSATTGNTTALPASITMSSNTATGAYTVWFGIN